MEHNRDNPVSQEGVQARAQDLIARYRAGEEAAFALLVEKFQQELFHFLLRFVGNRAAAEDIFQDTFLQVHVSIKSYDPQRPFKPWLFTIAANKARDHLRRSNQRKTTTSLSNPADGRDGSSGELLDLIDMDLPQPADMVDRQQMQERVRQEIDGLPDHLREILLLAYFNQFAYKEIAHMLGIPLGTVKSRLHAAVAAFAQRYKAQNPDEEGANPPEPPDVE